MPGSQRRTLLAVHAHPDDETITMGGTLARYSANGVRTVVITATLGELATVFEPMLLGQPVGPLRAREQEAAARVLGISRVVHLGYLDSGMAGAPDNHRAGAFFAADLQEAASRVQSVIDEERPRVLVTYDATGGYGHPDHVKAHQVTLAAYGACPAGVRPQRLYFVRYPLSWSREFVHALRGAGINAPASAAAGADAGPRVAEIGVDDRLIDTAIDVRAYVTTKERAVACHLSQWPQHHFIRRITGELAARLWAHEFYSREPAVASAPQPATSVFDRLAAGELETDLFS
jgi:N-acetyl-1-D-myo-inositol-2-amino-2-deoxy-alpha-D-glucopyranoside deacetylase